MVKIIKPHRYKGEDFTCVDEFKDAEHENWACDGSRKYGEADSRSVPQVKSKTEGKKRKLK